MIQDLHSHTYYSFCGKDKPEVIINAATDSGIELFGICDHNYGVGLQRAETVFQNEEARIADYQRSLNAYFDHLTLLQKQFAEKIKILRGIEIATVSQPHLLLPDGVDISSFDYCLIEHIDREDTAVDDLFAFAKRCGCTRIGVAHTDLPSFLDKSGKDKYEYFSRMAENGIFWEMNVNYDSIHGYNEHAYVKHFLEDEALQDIIRRSGVQLSVGFDGHRTEDYAPDRIISCCKNLRELGIPLAFS